MGNHSVGRVSGGSFGRVAVTTVLTRDSYDPGRLEIRRLAVAALVLLTAGAAWRWASDGLIYDAARSSIGCPGREDLIAAALRQADPSFPDEPRSWNYNLARPEWIAWTSVREIIPQKGGSQLPKWQVAVADSNLTVKGVVAGGGLTLPPEDADGDGRCEVVMDIVPSLDDARQDIGWRAVLRLGDDHNELVWLGLCDESNWHARKIRPKPIWRDEEGDGQDELVFITVEFVRTPTGGGAFKPPRVIAVFEWTSPGGILQARSLPDDSGILLWDREKDAPLRVNQDTDLDSLVRELLPADKMP